MMEVNTKKIVIFTFLVFLVIGFVFVCGCSAGSNHFDWNIIYGDWNIKGNDLVQKDTSLHPALIVAKNINKSQYILTCQARKISGEEGVLIVFHYKDNNHWLWWNIGGWGNTKSVLEYDEWAAGNTIPDTETSDSIQTNKWYNIKLVVDEFHIKGYIDEKLKFDVKLAEKMSSAGSIGFATWSTSSEYKNIKITTIK